MDLRAVPELRVNTGGEMIFIEGFKSIIRFVGSEFRQNLQIILSGMLNSATQKRRWVLPSKPLGFLRHVGQCI